ncbi:hypothetical protein BX666DRAFT_1161285 [Dichotomocladium elegans]|nr:hypothetical protein BX666DRAFT_1161285 [Dichotomocladium elegans]
MPDFASVALSIAMVVGPIIGYVDQYFIIRRKRSSAGFNSLTCGVLLVANILRVFFWFGKRNLDDGDERTSPALEEIDDDEEADEGMIQHQRPGPRFLSSVWAWDHYLNYINFLLGLTTVIGVLYLLLSRYPAFVEVIGFVSVGIESTLPVPQCISNFKRRSTAGFSLLVLATWLSIDMLIVFQFVLFSDRIRKGASHSGGQHLAITVPDADDDIDHPRS